MSTDTTHPLKRWRLKQGLSLRALAERTKEHTEDGKGLTHGAIDQLEKGMVQPRLSTIDLFATVTEGAVRREDWPKTV